MSDDSREITLGEVTFGPLWNRLHVCIMLHQYNSPFWHVSAQTSEGRRLGRAFFYIVSADTLHLDDIRVHPPYNRRGVGSAVLRHALVAAQQLGYSVIKAYTTPQDRHTNPHLLDWYRGHGFSWDTAAFNALMLLPMVWRAPGHPA